jgi:hypothetical protein
MQKQHQGTTAWHQPLRTTVVASRSLVSQLLAAAGI